MNSVPDRGIVWRHLRLKPVATVFHILTLRILPNRFSSGLHQKCVSALQASDNWQEIQEHDLLMMELGVRVRFERWNWQQEG